MMFVALVLFQSVFFKNQRPEGPKSRLPLDSFNICFRRRHLAEILSIKRKNQKSIYQNSSKHSCYYSI